MAPRNEKVWSSLAHLSIFLNLLVPFAGIVAALVIRVIYLPRSPRVSFNALQALWFQALWALLGFTAFTALGFGTALFVCAMLLALPVKAAYKINRGEDYLYPAASYLKVRV
jgi:uncharacterized Tic20 family protein